MIYLYVGIGGALGSILRYLVSIISLNNFGGIFPYGTIIVNLIGAYLLGWFTSAFINKKKINPQLATAIGTGLIGSFTTLSTFSVDLLMLFQKGHHLAAFLYLLISTLGGLFFSFLGLRLGKKVK